MATMKPLNPPLHIQSPQKKYLPSHMVGVCAVDCWTGTIPVDSARTCVYVHVLEATLSIHLLPSSCSHTYTLGHCWSHAGHMPKNSLWLLLHGCSWACYVLYVHAYLYQVTLQIPVGAILQLTHTSGCSKESHIVITPPCWGYKLHTYIHITTSLPSYYTTNSNNTGRKLTRACWSSCYIIKSESAQIQPTIYSLPSSWPARRVQSCLLDKHLYGST